MKFRFLILGLLVFSLISGNLMAQDSGSAELGDVFGSEGGYVHPFGSLSYLSTDNVYFANEDPTSDAITTLSLGVWLAVPASRDQLLNLNTTNYAPGGLELSREYKPYEDRFQFYLLASGEVENYAEEDDNNVNKGKAEGFFQYNLKGGLTFEIIGQYNHEALEKEVARDSNLDDTYTTTLATAVVLYHINESSRIELEGSSYGVKYDEKEYESKNRSDSSAALYFHYGFSEITKFFVGYEQTDVKYDEDTINNTQSEAFIGINWKATEKSSGKLKAGQTTKTFEDSDVYDDAASTFAELTVNHAFTEKTSLSASGTKKFRETSTAVSSYYYVHNQTLSLTYNQSITEKLGFNASYSYTLDTYNAVSGKDREDTTTSPNLTVSYDFTDWLSAEVGGGQTKVDSNINTLDATENTAYIRVTGYL